MCLSSVRVFSSACHLIQRPALKPNASNENHIEHISNYVLSEVILFRYLFRSKATSSSFQETMSQEIGRQAKYRKCNCQKQDRISIHIHFCFNLSPFAFVLFFFLTLSSQEFIMRLMLRYSDHSGYTENSVVSFPMTNATAHSQRKRS